MILYPNIMEPLIDIHTHNTGSSQENSILCTPSYIEGRNISLGIHPWDITEEWEEQLAEIIEKAKARNVIAIGECGIDSIKSPASHELQYRILNAHATISEELGKPMIIHCVKGIDHVLRLHSSIKPRQAWIIHGFRGKPQQAAQFTDRGIYISLGEHFNTESALHIPSDRILVESDDSSRALHEIYKAIATARGYTIDELAAQVVRNAKTIFKEWL